VEGLDLIARCLGFGLPRALVIQEKIAQAVGELSADARLNSRVPHLEGESIFGSTKRKLDLPPGDDSDSHQHDRVNFTLPKIGHRMTPGQSCRRRGLTKSTINAPPVVALTRGHLPIRESECDPMSWRIERINPPSAIKCKALGSNQKKWIYCKHIYFILQKFMGCTLEDKFVHYPAYTFNEVNLLLDRADALSSRD
jgi:hypothetical protein